MLLWTGVLTNLHTTHEQNVSPASLIQGLAHSPKIESKEKVYFSPWMSYLMSKSWELLSHSLWKIKSLDFTLPCRSPNTDLRAQESEVQTLTSWISSSPEHRLEYILLPFSLWPCCLFTFLSKCWFNPLKWYYKNLINHWTVFQEFRELNGLTEASGGHHHGRRFRWDCMARDWESNRNWGKSGTSSVQQLKSLAAVSHVLADSLKDLVQIYKGM